MNSNIKTGLIIIAAVVIGLATYLFSRGTNAPGTTTQTTNTSTSQNNPETCGKISDGAARQSCFNSLK